MAFERRILNDEIRIWRLAESLRKASVKLRIAKYVFWTAGQNWSPENYLQMIAK